MCGVCCALWGGISRSQVLVSQAQTTARRAPTHSHSLISHTPLTYLHCFFKHCVPHILTLCSFFHSLQSPRTSSRQVKGSLLVVTHIMCEYLLAELEQQREKETGVGLDPSLNLQATEEFAAKYHTESYFIRLFVRDFPKYPVHMYALSYAECQALHAAAPGMSCSRVTCICKNVYDGFDTK